MGDLTENFSLDEFLVSSKADSLGIKNTPTPLHLNRIRTVTAPGMQLVRNYVRRSIVMTSAYRNELVNRLVGGVPHSAHTEGWATDSRAAGLSAIAYARLVAQGMADEECEFFGKIDQLILETSRRIVHLSFDPRRRGQILTQRGGPGTPFKVGIVA